MFRTSNARHRALAGLTAGAGIFAIAPFALATTYQVGADKTYGSLDQVASLLAPGDIVEVDGDATYGDIQLTQSGTSAQKITIRGVRVNGKRPVFSGGTNTMEVYADHYVLEGIDLTGGSFRCFFHHGDDITLRDSVIHDCPGHGLLGADSDSGSLTMEYVEVYASGAGDTRHQVYMATDEEVHPGSVFRMQHCYVHDGHGGNNVKTRAERNEIYYNWIEGAVYHELELIGPDGQEPSLAREDSDVVGNVFKKTGTSFITRVGGDGTGDTGGRYRFVNNTFILVQGSASVFRLFDQLESIEMHNNVLFREGGGGVKVIQDSDAAWTTGSAILAGTSNWLQDGSTTIPTEWTKTVGGEDPGFADLAGNDLVPVPTSALVDQGNAATAGPPGHDFPSPLALPEFLPPPGAIEAQGTALARPVVGPVDIGAYEYGVDMSSGSGSPAGSGGATGAGGAGATSGAGAGATSGGETGPSGAGASGFLGETPASGEGDTGGCACRTSRREGGSGLLVGAGLLAATWARRRRAQRR